MNKYWCFYREIGEQYFASASIGLHLRWWGLKLGASLDFEFVDAEIQLQFGPVTATASIGREER